MTNPRVIGGSARGIRLKPVPGDTTRPVTDRVKEALFNIIGGDIINASMLDVFGGTGSIGIEALSRGASYVRFIDNNLSAVQTIKTNLAMTKLQPQGEVIHADALLYLRRNPERTFDYIYVAPPQYKGLWLDCLNTIDSNRRWMSSDAWIIVQIHPIEKKETSFQNFEMFDTRQYGSTLLLFFLANP